MYTLLNINNHIVEMYRKAPTCRACSDIVYYDIYLYVDIEKHIIFPCPKGRRASIWELSFFLHTGWKVPKQFVNWIVTQIKNKEIPKRFVRYHVIKYPTAFIEVQEISEESCDDTTFYFNHELNAWYAWLSGVSIPGNGTDQFNPLTSIQKEWVDRNIKHLIPT